MFLFLRHLLVYFSLTSYSRLGCWFQNHLYSPGLPSYKPQLCLATRLRVLYLNKIKPIPFFYQINEVLRRSQLEEFQGRFFFSDKRKTRAEKISAEITPFLSFLNEVKGAQGLEILQPPSKHDRKVKSSRERPFRAPAVLVRCPWQSVLATANCRFPDILRGPLYLNTPVAEGTGALPMLLLQSTAT